MSGGFLRLQDEFAADLALQQREADRQASRWIERELIRLMRPGAPAPFDGHQPTIGYNKKTGNGLLIHEHATVRRFDIRWSK